MSDFTGEGFKPFPNTIADTKHLEDIANEERWPTANLEAKVWEYGEFLSREDIMIRARTMGERILTHLVEEIAHRDGQYNHLFDLAVIKNEDEVCEQL